MEEGNEEEVKELSSGAVAAGGGEGMTPEIGQCVQIELNSI